MISATSSKYGFIVLLCVVTCGPTPVFSNTTIYIIIGVGGSVIIILIIVVIILSVILSRTRRKRTLIRYYTRQLNYTNSSADEVHMAYAERDLEGTDDVEY